MRANHIVMYGRSEQSVAVHLDSVIDEGGPRYRKGVHGSPDKAHPPRDRRLRAFVTRVLADADRSGFTIDDLITTLNTYQKEGT
jgi:hypothetical protein